MLSRKKHFKVIRDYLKLVVSQYKHIQHFAEIHPVSMNKILGEYKKNDLQNEYGLSFLGYEGALDADSQKTTDHVTISLCVFKKVKDVSDEEELNEALSGAEMRAMDILARIKVDSLENSNLVWLYNKFINNGSIEYATRIYEGAHAIVGFEFHFTLKIHNPLTLHQEDWDNYEINC